MSSFLGIGGGPINLVALFFFFSMTPKIAAYCSVFIIMLSQTFSIGTTIITQGVTDIPVEMLVCMVVGGVAGGFIGTALSGKMNDDQIKTLFTWSLLGILLIAAYNVVSALV